MKDLPLWCRNHVRGFWRCRHGHRKGVGKQQDPLQRERQKENGDKVEIKVAEDGNLIEVSPDDVKEEEDED